MSKTQLLKAFVNERLAATAVEIFGVFERTIAEYENEAFRSKQEIERQRMLLDHLLTLKQQSDISLFPVCKEETHPEQQHCEQDWIPSLDQVDPEPPQIKEEQQELWTCQGGEHFKEPDGEAGIIQFELPSPTAKSDYDQDPTPSSQPQIQRSETVNEMQSGGSQASVSILNTLKSKKTQIVKRQRSGISSKSKRSIESHVKSTHFSCKVCGKTFQYKGFLLKHLHQTHTEEKEMVCGVCGESFESPESLTGHLKTHNDKYTCHICGVCFAKKHILMAHMTCHREVKLHHCHVCGRECGRKGDLKIHMRIHTGEKPYCCSYCSKSFTHSGHLKKHIRSHTGERLYRCQVCDKGFTQTSRLVRHMASHSECHPNQQFNLSSVN